MARSVRLVGQLRNELTGESSRVEFIGQEQSLDDVPRPPRLDFGHESTYDPLSDPLDDPFPEERR